MDASVELTKPGATLEPSFERVLAEEGASIGSASAPAAAAGPHIGVAMSGGGIRAAAFGLGFLQALHARDVLARVDYLSAVSGGSYTAAAYVAGKKRLGRFPFEAGGEGEFAPQDIADSPAVERLRDRCRYLMPNGPFDLVVSSAVLLRGIAVNLVLVATALFFLASVTMLAYPDLKSLEASWLVRVIPDPQHPVRGLGDGFLATKVAALSLFAVLLAWALARTVVGSVPRARDGSDDEPSTIWARISGVALLAFAVAVLSDVLPLLLQATHAWLIARKTEVGAGEAPSLRELVAFLSAATTLLGLIGRWLLGVVRERQGEEAWRARLAALGSGLVLLALALALPLLLFTIYLWLVTTGLDGAAAKWTWLFGVMTRLDVAEAARALVVGVVLLVIVLTWSAWFGRPSQTVLNRAWWSAGADERDVNFWLRLPAVLLGVFLLVEAVWPEPILPPTAALLEGLIARCVREAAAIEGDMALRYGAIAVWLLLIAGAFAENANSLHELYRARLKDAFALHFGAAGRLSELAGTTPFLMVNAAVNMQGSKRNHRKRNADFFVFTPERCGSDATGYAATTEMEKREPRLDLASIVAISGASISSAMGRAGDALLAPTRALLNLRLGYWLLNPACVGSWRTMRAGLRDWQLSFILAEIFGWLDERRSKVHLSDGGHIDNLGLYALLKRRCDLIVVCDAEHDPGMTFASLVDVERFARIDLGVRLELSWARLRESARARKAARGGGDLTAQAPPDGHGVSGAVLYPAVTGRGGRPILPPKIGRILYVKATVTGDERSYILDYERRHRSFPQESTGDQFFSEEQFEAYRALGFHATIRALENAPSEKAEEESFEAVRAMLR